MKRILLICITAICSISLFTLLQSSPQQRTNPMAYSPMGFAWANAVSESHLVPANSTPFLIAEAPATESLIIRNVWSSANYASIDIEKSITGQSMRFLSGSSVHDGTGNYPYYYEYNGWKGIYVLEPGDKLWATNNASSDSDIHWSGFYLN